MFDRTIYKTVYKRRSDKICVDNGLLMHHYIAYFILC